MTIGCDHPRPKLNLPGYTPPRYAWQPPAFLPSSSLADLSRALTEQLRGIYAVLQQVGQRRTIVPLIEDIDARIGQVIVGVGAGQTIRLPEGIAGELGQVGIVLTDVSSPVTLVHPDGTTTSLGTAGAYDFVSGIPETYQTNPGGTVVSGAIPTDTLIGRDSPGTGVFESITLTSPLEFTGAQSIRIATNGISDSLIRQSAGFSVIGRAGTGTGNVADIVLNDLSVLGRAGVLGTDVAGIDVPDTSVFTGESVFLRVASTRLGIQWRPWTLVDMPEMPTSRFVGNVSGATARPTYTSFGDLSSTSITFEFTGETFIREALFGDVVALQNDNETTIQPNVVSDAKLRDSGALSVIGRAFNSAGDPADISAVAASGAVLRESGSTVGFGTITLGAFPSIANDTFLANIAGSTAQPTAVALSGIAGVDLTYNASTHAFDWDGLEIETQDDGIIGNALNLAFVNGVNTAAVGVNNGGGQMLVRVDVDNFPLTALADQADDTFLANISGGLAPPTAVPLATLAGDGIQGGANAILNIDVSDFAGTGLEDDGSENLRIAAAAAGSGLTGGGGSALAVGAGTHITVNADDVAVNLTTLVPAIDSTSIIANGTVLERAALTGDVTASQNSNATTIATGAVTLAKLANQADDTFLANVSGSNAPPSAVALTTLAGAGLTGGADAILAVGAGTGITVNANDVAVTIPLTDGDKGDISVASSGTSWTIDSNAVTTAKIADDNVTLAKLENVAAGTVLGLQTDAGADANPVELTGLELAELLRIGTTQAVSVSGTVNDQSLNADTTVLRLTPTGSQTVTGMTGGVQGRVVFIENIAGSGNDIILASLSASSAVANRFRTPRGLNLTLGFRESVIARWETNNGDWRIIYLGVPLSDGDKGDITLSSGATVWTIDNDVVSDAKLRNSAALSVIGRSANSTGDPADIAAANDGEVLRRSGTTVGFGTVATAGIADAAVTLAKQADLAQSRIIGRAEGAGTGVPTALTPTQVVAIIDGEAATWTGVHSFTGSSHTINVTGAANIDADAASRFTTSVGNLTLSTTQAGTAVAISGADDVTIDAVTDDVIVTSGGATTVTSGTIFRVTTAAVERLEIRANGAWQIDGSDGSAGDVLTSSGASSTPTWVAIQQLLQEVRAFAADASITITPPAGATWFTGEMCAGGGGGGGADSETDGRATAGGGGGSGSYARLFGAITSGNITGSIGGGGTAGSNAGGTGGTGGNTVFTYDGSTSTAVGGTGGTGMVDTAGAGGGAVDTAASADGGDGGNATGVFWDIVFDGGSGSPSFAYGSGSSEGFNAARGGNGGASYFGGGGRGGRVSQAIATANGQGGLAPGSGGGGGARLVNATAAATGATGGAGAPGCMIIRFYSGPVPSTGNIS